MSLLAYSFSWGAAKPSHPPSAKLPANKLDTSLIHKTYLDGDFDVAIEFTEDGMKYGGAFSHEDSIFIFKHLGVMHTAKYETREKGKSYPMLVSDGQ